MTLPGQRWRSVAASLALCGAALVALIKVPPGAMCLAIAVGAFAGAVALRLRPERAPWFWGQSPLSNALLGTAFTCIGINFLRKPSAPGAPLLVLLSVACFAGHVLVLRREARLREGAARTQASAGMSSS